MAFRIFLISCFLALPVFAQTTLPSFDQATPRGALKLFFSAQTHDDGDAMQALLISDNPAEQHIIAAVADQKNADKVLTDALIAKFPDQWKSDPRKAEAADLSSIFDNIDQAELQITGDTATLHAAGSDQPPFTLKRINGRWRIPLAVLFQSLDPADLENRAHQIEIQVEVMREAAKDVAAGKYSTKEEAADEVKQRIFTAALADHTAATQATTQP
jgi:hypothetical protein